MVIIHVKGCLINKVWPTMWPCLCFRFTLSRIQLNALAKR